MEDTNSFQAEKPSSIAGERKNYYTYTATFSKEIYTHCNDVKWNKLITVQSSQSTAW